MIIAEQKKALLVEFAKGTDSDFAQIQGNTSETVQILRSMQKGRGGLMQQADVGTSLLPRTAEPASEVARDIAKVADLPKKIPEIIKKNSVTESVQKAVSAKPAEIKKAAAKSRDERGQFLPKEAAKKPPAAAKEDLEEARRSKGLFKKIGGVIINSFKRGGDADEKRDRASSDKSEAKETGMLALFGPLAPALQEIKELRGEKDEDAESLAGKLIGKFKKEKPEKAEETPENEPGKSGTRDEGGRFIPKRAIGLPAPQKAEESPEVVERLDVVHSDLISGDKDQKKRDKKNIRAIRGIEAGGGGIGLGLGGFGSKIKSLLPLLGKLAVGAAGVLAAFDFVSGWKDEKLQKEAFGLKEGEEATTRQQSAAASASVIDLGGITTGIASWVKGEEVTRADLTEGLYKFSGRMNEFFGDVDEELKGKQLEKYGTPGQKGEPAKKYDPYARTRNISHPGVRARDKSKKDEGPPGQKTSRYDYGYSAAAARAGVPETKPMVGVKSAPGSWEAKARKTMPGVGARTASEDRSPRVARKEKEVQKKIEISNKDLIRETEKTNELLAKLLNQKGGIQQGTQDQHIPSGIMNESDIAAIRGLD